MAGDDDALAQFESTVTSSATKIASLANLAAGPTAVVGFLAEGVFKGIRLGMAINAKAKEINAKLDSTIRARSFIRTPIVLDLGEVDFRNFYENKANIAAFPVLSEMAREIAEFDNTGGLVLPATKAKLQAALVPINDRSLSGLPRSRSAGMTDADQLFVSRSRNGLRGDRSTDEGQQRHVSPKPTSGSHRRPPLEDAVQADLHALPAILSRVEILNLMRPCISETSNPFRPIRPFEEMPAAL